ncbi:hypothetical protein [Meridianimarinicoccus aquatilis]|uniref:Lipoprotein n=1 Tax=Meridianimarinicoccus aquatilis TaxID=2552766 RepID=A0A4R6B5X6_9RHOB|nr:hypothetical protein [Fluviibacterium aquatile]QIE41383.1 hypothetical protein G5B39_05080 [Rhodobacteraceae bacterium SC52]TDL91478.1 hypothetical protein E2L05_00805 [Fluviibacterium aquatile]
MIACRQILRPATALALLSVLGLAACDGALPSRTTERVTTATLRYNAAAHTDEQARAELVKMCGEAELKEVSQPVIGDDGLFEVTATCLSTYDGRGNLIPNKT